MTAAATANRVFRGIDRRSFLGASSLLTLACLLHRPVGGFTDDAAFYWESSQALVDLDRGRWSSLIEVRGVLTSVIYLPAAVMDEITRGVAPGLWVFAENACLILLLALIVIPRIVAQRRPVTATTLWVSAVACALLLTPFAPYPLTDLWAVSLFLIALAGLTGSASSRLFASGLLLGAAVNIRPAYLLAGILVLVVLFLHRRAALVPTTVGVAVTGLLQSLTNLTLGFSPVPWPTAIWKISALQDKYSGFSIRYDASYAPPEDPRLFSCSRTMARLISEDGLTPAGALVSFLHHPLAASWFSFQKAAGSVHWSSNTPYAGPSTPLDAVTIVAATGLTVIGALLLIGLPWAGAATTANLPRRLQVVAWVGTLTTLVASVPESRFAILLVLIGLICILSADLPLFERVGVSQASRATIVVSVLAVVATIAVLAVGSNALNHPYRGDATPATCSTA